MIRFTRTRTAFTALMLSVGLALPLAQSAAPHVAHAASGPKPYQVPFLGTWHNSDRNTRGITVIRVTYDSFWQNLRMDVWAKCSPEDCYWGHSGVAYNLPNVYGSFYLNVEHGVDLFRTGADLQVTDDASPYPWQSGKSSTTHYTFLPGA